MLRASREIDASATGIGDVVGRLKVNVMQKNHIGAAILGEVRFPTGDENNLLGSGERFRVVARLGAGGMGVVYKAFDHEHQTHVALKTLLRVDAAELFRFKAEFRALASHAHPNWVRLGELLMEAGLPDGVFNIVHGDATCVEALLVHPLVRAVSFVGSTAVARYVYETGTRNGKRVQSACKTSDAAPARNISRDTSAPMTRRISSSVCVAASSLSCSGVSMP